MFGFLERTIGGRRPTRAATAPWTQKPENYRAWRSSTSRHADQRSMDWSRPPWRPWRCRAPFKRSTCPSSDRSCSIMMPSSEHGRLVTQLPEEMRNPRRCRRSFGCGASTSVVGRSQPWSNCSPQLPRPLLPRRRHIPQRPRLSCSACAWSSRTRGSSCGG